MKIESERLALAPTHRECRIAPAVWFMIAALLLRFLLLEHEALAQDQPPESLTGPDGGGLGLPFGFGVNISDNLYYVYLFLAFLVFGLMAQLHYMALALGKVRQGVHPTTGGVARLVENWRIGVSS